MAYMVHWFACEMSAIHFNVLQVATQVLALFGEFMRPFGHNV